MPERSERLQQTHNAAGKYELPYISKSRVMQWIQNPEHFRLKYLEGIEPEETEAMRRGTEVHEAFEDFYHGVVEEHDFYQVVTHFPEYLDDDYYKWGDHVTPYLSNFIAFETRRFDATDLIDDYLPIAVEEEMWRDPLLGIDGEPEWMGLVDAIYPAASIDEVGPDSGVVVVDFKTGSVPDEKYRNEGIYTELEYYTMLFEEKYDVVAAAAYYPREDTFVVQPDEPKFRDNIIYAAQEMVTAVSGYDGDAKFDIKPGPLCKWGPSDDEESAFYGVCSQCTWGAPVNNQNTFEHMVEEGYSMDRIADELGTTKDAVGYWKYKLDL